MTQQQPAKAPRGADQVWATMTIKQPAHITDVDRAGNKLMSRGDEPGEQWAIQTFYEWDATNLEYPTDKHYINKSVITPKPGSYSVLLRCGNVKPNKGGTYDNDYHYDIMEWAGVESEVQESHAQEGTPEPQRNVSPPSNVERRDQTPPLPRMDPTQERITYLSCQHDASEIMASAMEEILIACRPPDSLSGSERIEQFMNNFERDALPYIARVIPLLTDALVDSVKSKNLLP